ncbi:MAG: branched-chain amino acid transaminase [Longimicrobiales bacterium]|nr:branched-chain amino acid transaminase [Longimicrobiales bacterium]
MSIAGLKTGWIWKDGRFVPWESATLHVMSHVVHYGSSVFEGVRCYDTSAGPAFFRLQEHLVRLLDSARIYQMQVPFDLDTLCEASRELFRRNGLREGYLRPLIIRGLGGLGVNPLGSPVEVYLMCWPWGRYLGAEALEQGVDVCVSTWFRPAPNTFPALAKAGGNYLNSQLSKMEAIRNGYAEGIAVSPDGLVSEGSGQNVFLVKKGVVYTPQIDGTMLAGITRDTVLYLCREVGVEAREERVPREMLYTADEAFFSGTAAEITPIRSVDRVDVGGGGVGPVTRELQEAYLALVHGTRTDACGWLDFVGWPAAEAAS